MSYSSFLLNGAWEMNYRAEAYNGTENPWKTKELNLTPGKAFVENAVPGYWEDMTETFLRTPFYRMLRINPEYGLQQYPISDVAPDMALPNVEGNFFYQRVIQSENITKPAVLHFAGVQNTVSVWINDVYIGKHEGYSTPFDIQIPEGLLKDGENTIALSVSNFRLEGYDGYPVSGLTSRAANECTGGITGDVELRVYDSPLRDVVLNVAEDVKSVSVSVEGTSVCETEWKVLDGEKTVKSGKATGDFVFETDGLELWSPENPKLYTLVVTDGEGSIERTFGVRRLVPDGPHFRLNGIPYFLRGICEHCYFPETIHPAHDLTYYRSIIREIKKLGFNFIRFHTYVPEEEYMQAADELGVLVQVESPNNTSYEEWEEIVRFCRRHASVVIYCCGNELQMDDDFIKHTNACADYVHANTDSLFSPLSALRGLEYAFAVEPDKMNEVVNEPFPHNPTRFATVSKFADLYSSFTNSVHSYESTKCDPAVVDSHSAVYHHKPRVTHEICIDGTYTDLSVKDRYKGTRVGKTDMFSSLEAHLESKGLLKNAPLYFKNSSEWQRRVRKHCFEAVRRSENIAGYDFLGPIDTHWHTFGYDVGMMNEFYELKPGETIRNVKMYNSETVLLTDLNKKANFKSGETLSCKILCSSYYKEEMKNANLDVRLMLGDEVIARRKETIASIENGKVSEIYDLKIELPEVTKPGAMKLAVTLDCDTLYAENEWELYIFPEVSEEASDIFVSDGMTKEELIASLKAGKDVLLLSARPFQSLPCTYKISLAGRCSGNLATVIGDHPALGDIPHEGFCGWQFADLFEGGEAVCFENDEVPFHPIIEVVSSHKYIIRQAALFEFKAFGGRCLVCSFDFKDTDPAAAYLKAKLLSYMKGDAFAPADEFSEDLLHKLFDGKVKAAAKNTNVAFNPNDKTAIRKK